MSNPNSNDQINWQEVSDKIMAEHKASISKSDKAEDSDTRPFDETQHRELMAEHRALVRELNVKNGWSR